MKSSQVVIKDPESLLELDLRGSALKLALWLASTMVENNEVLLMGWTRKNAAREATGVKSLSNSLSQLKASGVLVSTSQSEYRVNSDYFTRGQ